MAPELGNDGAMVNSQSDVYSIGMIFQELLTGIPPETPDADRIVVHDERLSDVCRKATHPDPSMRFVDARAMADALKECMSPAISKSAPRPRQASACRPKPSAVPRPAPRAGSGMLRNCAVIGFLLISIYGLWGHYIHKREALVRLQQTDEVKPRMVEGTAEASAETSRGMESAIVQFESEP
jgi:serine/threonine protein kinase